MATSQNTNYGKYIQSDQRHATLGDLSTLIIDNIEVLAKNIKEQLDKLDLDEPSEANQAFISAFEEFSEYLLQNSFSSDLYCRYESQKVLHALAQKFFAVVSQDCANISDWIMSLIQKCNLVVNKKIDDSQMQLLADKTAKHSAVDDLINHLTAQLQGINWLVSDMQVDLELLVNADLMFNIVSVASMLEAHRRDGLSDDHKVSSFV